MPDQTRLLVVDDDADIRELLSAYLARYDMTVETAADGAGLFEKLDHAHFDLIILDIMLPGEDGLSLCRRLRGTSAIPVIFLTSLDSSTDRVVGLELGADDYVPKAFSPRELLARVRAVLRRAQPVQAERKEPEEDGVVRVRGLWMDRKSMKARMDGVPMDLTALEFRILFGMAAHPGRVFTRENLLELAVGREFSRYDRSVDMHISTLRRKLGDDPHNPAYLKTIRGMGYTLLPEEA